MGIHHLARRIEKTRLGPLCRVHGPSAGPWLLSLLPLERRRTPPPERQYSCRRRENHGRLQSGSHRKTKRQQGRQSHLRSGRDAGGNPSFHGGKPEQAHVYLFFHQPSPRPGRYSSGRKHVRGLPCHPPGLWQCQRNQQGMRRSGRRIRFHGGQAGQAGRSHRGHRVQAGRKPQRRRKLLRGRRRRGLKLRPRPRHPPASPTGRTS